MRPANDPFRTHRACIFETVRRACYRADVRIIECDVHRSVPRYAQWLTGDRGIVILLSVACERGGKTCRLVVPEDTPLDAIEDRIFQFAVNWTPGAFGQPGQV